jgi:hypothetical protein
MKHNWGGHPCASCSHQAAHISSLLIHKRSIHEGKKYPCDYQANAKLSLIRHNQSLHEGITSPCESCAYQATLKANLYKHRKTMHEGKKYPWSQYTLDILNQFTIKDSINKFRFNLKQCNVMALLNCHLSTHNYAPLGLWALIQVLTGEEEENIHDPTLFGVTTN